jgi:predicted nucleotidyltransferase
MNTDIFKNIQTLKRQLLPNDRLILFGSQARGDARPDSDWDLLVLLNKPEKEFQDEDIYGYPFAEIGFPTGTYISAKVFTEQDWKQQKPSLFYKNIEKDGIEIV